MDLLDALEPMGAFYVFVDGSAVLGKSYKGTKIESVPQMADILINEYNTAIVPCADFGFPDCFPSFLMLYLLNRLRKDSTGLKVL